PRGGSPCSSRLTWNAVVAGDANVPPAQQVPGTNLARTGYIREALSLSCRKNSVKNAAHQGQAGALLSDAESTSSNEGRQHEHRCADGDRQVRLARQQLDKRREGQDVLH